jgi:hypothetical protein
MLPERSRTPARSRANHGAHRTVHLGPHDSRRLTVGRLYLRGAQALAIAARCYASRGDRRLTAEPIAVRIALYTSDRKIHTDSRSAFISATCAGTRHRSQMLCISRRMPALCRANGDIRARSHVLYAETTAPAHRQAAIHPVRRMIRRSLPNVRRAEPRRLRGGDLRRLAP